MITQQSLIDALKASLEQRFKGFGVPQDAGGMGQFIGNAVRDDLNQIQAMGYLPAGLRWKEVFVDFNKYDLWPQYQVIVRWL